MGQALDARRRYEGLTEAERDALLDFLNSLVLCAPETLPCDGKAFNPERFFRVPGRPEGWTTAPDGSRIFSRALLDVEEAYGCLLPFLADRDRDGFPDRLFTTF